jgi:branched-chain amino acid transport system substrate-binding protein
MSFSLARRIGASCAFLALTSIACAPFTSADQAPVKVGIVFSYTGGGGDGPTLLDTGIAAFVKEHGDTAGGRKVVLIKRDDTGIAPEVARRQAQDLILNEKVDLLAGLLFTPNAIAVADVSTQAKKPLLIVNAATSGILTKNPYSFRFGITTAQITSPLAAYAAKSGAKTVFALFQDYGPGIDAGTSFEKGFIAAGGTIVGEARIPVTTQEFAAYLQRVKDAHPDILYVFLNGGGSAPAFLRGYRQSGLARSAKLFATGDLADDSKFALTGDDALGIVSASNYYAMLDSPLNRKFVSDYKSLAPAALDNPDFVAVSAYDTMAAIYRVIDAQHGSIDPDKTVELLSHIKLDSPRGEFMIDPQTRDAVQNVYILRTEKHNGVVANVRIATIPMVKDPNEH